MGKNLWINKKNGKTYQVINENILNCTNAQDGEVMYLYRVYSEKVLDENGKEKLFVRSKEEFLQKFKKYDKNI